MRLQNMKGRSPKSINSALNAIRREMNSPAAVKRVRIVRDYEEYRDFTDERQRIEEEQRKAEGHPEYDIEVTEETVEALITEHDDAAA